MDTTTDFEDLVEAESRGLLAAVYAIVGDQHRAEERLVVDGRPILLTDQTLEALDPESFASTQIAYHPTEPSDFYR